MHLLTPITAALLASAIVGGCGQPAPNGGDMACEDGKLPEGASCTTMDQCCKGMFCVAFNRTPPVCCHTVMSTVCDMGECCPIGAP